MLEEIYTSVFLGDALGAPYEFYAGRKRFSFSDTDGQFVYPVVYYKPRFKTLKVMARGGVTDDSEMTMVLIQVFLECIKLNLISSEDIKRRLIFRYVEWAVGTKEMPGCPFMGRNTRKLFVMKTVKFDRLNEGKITEREVIDYVNNKYESNFQKTFKTNSYKDKALSNGSLMRCTGLLPFLIFNQSIKFIEKIAKIDVYITNPNTLSLQVVVIYLKLILNITKRQGQITPASYKDILLMTINECRDHFVILDERLEEVISMCLDYKDSDLIQIQSYPMGYILVAFYYSLVSYRAQSWKNCIGWVIEQEGDTDTNAAISGGVLGAILNKTVLVENEENIRFWKETSRSNHPHHLEDVGDVGNVRNILKKIDEDQDYDFSFKTQRPSRFSYNSIIDDIKIVDKCIEQTRAKYNL